MRETKNSTNFVRKNYHFGINFQLIYVNLIKNATNPHNSHPKSDKIGQTKRIKQHKINIHDFWNAFLLIFHSCCCSTFFLKNVISWCLYYLIYTWNKLSNRFKLIFRVQLYKIVFISHTIILDNTNILIVSSKTVAMLLCEPMRISLNLCFLSQFLSHLCFPLSLHRFRFLRSVVSKIGNKKSLQLELYQKGRIHIWLFYFQNSMHERPLCFSNKQI